MHFSLPYHNQINNSMKDNSKNSEQKEFLDGTNSIIGNEIANSHSFSLHKNFEEIFIGNCGVPCKQCNREKCKDTPASQNEGI